MKNLVLLSLLAVLVSAAPVTQDKADDLKKLFALMQVDKMINSTLDNMLPMLKQQAKSQFRGENANEKFNAFAEHISEEAKLMSKNLLEEEMLALYDKHFTHQEIKDLIWFYESPTGKKIIEKSPELTKEIMTKMMSKHLPELQNKITQYLDSIATDSN